MLSIKYASVLRSEENVLDSTWMTQAALEGISSMEVTGAGHLVITNTGGSSASEGGMGTGGGEEKGAGIQNPSGNDSGKQTSTTTKGSDDDEEWDPLKPKEEKEKGK